MCVFMSCVLLMYLLLPKFWKRSALILWFLQITVDVDRTVVAFYKFLKKHAAIPFKLQKPASTPKAEGSDKKDSSESSTTKDLKDEL